MTLFEIKHITRNEDEYHEIMQVIEKWERIDNKNKLLMKEKNVEKKNI